MTAIDQSSTVDSVTRVSRWHLIATLQVSEAVVLTASSALWLNDTLATAGRHATLFELLSFALAVALVVHFVLRALGAYDFAGVLDIGRSCTTAAAAWMLSTAPLIACAVKLQRSDALPNSVLVDWLASGLLIVLVRILWGYVGQALVTARLLSHNVLIVGGDLEAQQCAELLTSDQQGGRVVGFVAAPDIGPHSTALASLRAIVQAGNVSDIVIATAERDRDKAPDLVRELFGLPVRVLLWPQSIGVEAAWVETSNYRVGNVPLLLASAPPLEGWRWVLKDVLDRALALILLIVCLPVMLAISVALPLCDRGRILFCQEREGYNGRIFVIFKFRTMRMTPPQSDKLVLAVRNDQRVFWLGMLLRKTSLDELPQLLNVLRGDMWLVGPRPHSPLATAAGQPYAKAVRQYAARARVKPGITGWAQVNGWRGSTHTLEQIERRVQFDLYYIDHWSVWLDLKILIQTLAKGFIHQNAY